MINFIKTLDEVGTLNAFAYIEGGKGTIDQWGHSAVKQPYHSFKRESNEGGKKNNKTHD